MMLVAAHEALFPAGCMRHPVEDRQGVRLRLGPIAPVGDIGTVKDFLTPFDDLCDEQADANCRRRKHSKPYQHLTAPRNVAA